MSKEWTAERRKAQAERCRKNKPWKKSTGPKTPKGKARSSLNAFKHGMRCRKIDQLRYILWLQREFMNQSFHSLTGLNFNTNEVKRRMKKANKFK